MIPRALIAIAIEAFNIQVQGLARRPAGHADSNAS